MKIIVDDKIIVMNTDTLYIHNRKRYRYFWEILCAIEKQLNAMVSRHSKVMMLRLDFHLNSYTENNLEFSKIIEKLRKHLSRKYKMKRFGYIWAREIETSTIQHYHLTLLLNGNKISYPSKLIDWIEKIWTNRGHSKPFTPRNCFKLIKRGDENEIRSVFERTAYLAKVRGKKNRAAGVNDYSASRLKCHSESPRDCRRQFNLSAAALLDSAC